MFHFALFLLSLIQLMPVAETTQNTVQRHYGFGYPSFNFLGRFGGISTGNGLVYPSPYGASVGTFPIILPRTVKKCADGSAPLEPIRCTYQQDPACPRDYFCQTSLQACCRQKSDRDLRLSTPAPGSCPNGRPSRGLGCVSSSQCETGFYCPTSVGKCCKLGLPPATVTPPRQCPDGTSPIPEPSTCLHDADCSFSQYFCSLTARGCCLRPTVIANRTCPGGSLALASPSFCDTSRDCPQPNFVCSPSINACCPGRGTPGPEPEIQVQDVCPDGTAATIITCETHADCGETQYCWDNIAKCCTRPAGICPDGTPPVLDPPVCMPGLGQCGSSATCTGGVCCPVTIQEDSCPSGARPIGACVRGLCAVGFSCFSPGICCPSAPTGVCASGAQPVGGCYPGSNGQPQGQCGSGFVCEGGTICCPPTRLFRPNRITP